MKNDRIIYSVCVALIGLAALLGLEYALMRLWPLTTTFIVGYFIVYGLIVAGMTVGLDKVETVFGKSDGKGMLIPQGQLMPDVPRAIL